MLEHLRRRNDHATAIELKIQANGAAARYVAGNVTNLEHAREAGDFLCRVKKLIKHGSWTAWLNEFFKQSPETARIYMRIYLHWDEPAFVAAREEKDGLKSINAMLKLIRDAKDEKNQLPQLPDENRAVLKGLLSTYLDQHVDKLSEDDLRLFVKNFPKESFRRYIDAARSESLGKPPTLELKIEVLLREKLIWLDREFTGAYYWYEKKYPGTCKPKLSKDDILALMVEHFGDLWRHMMRGTVRIYAEQMAEQLHAEQLKQAHLDDYAWKKAKAATLNNSQLTEDELDTAHLADLEWEAVCAGEKFVPVLGAESQNGCPEEDDNDGWIEFPSRARLPFYH